MILGHMTKVADMPIYGKIVFVETDWPMSLKLDIKHWTPGNYPVCPNDDTMLIFCSDDDPMLAFDLFTQIKGQL